MDFWERSQAKKSKKNGGPLAFAGPAFFKGCIQMRRILSLALLLTCLWSNASGDRAVSLNEKGFLTADNPEEEWIYQDEEEGIWQYATHSLSIKIIRQQDDTPLVWYETEIWASEESPLQTCLSEGTKPGRKLINPLRFSRDEKLVLAITDDFSGYRIQNNQTIGIVVRGEVILGNKTRKSENTRSWPNLDTLAVYEDGSMKVYVSDAYSAEEYIEAGATNVFAFGPMLLSNGELTSYVLDESYYPYSEPRMAIGMIEPYHYIILTVEGRTDSSIGAKLPWLAKRMKELGVVEALNLDGGGTAALIFMGEVLNRSSKNMRSVNSLISFGRSDQVPD